jgi:hypothetical protein
MEKSISISNKVEGLDTDYFKCGTEFNLKIKYEHPKIKLDLIISDEELYYYSYEGSVESLLKYNNVQQTSISAEYFISSLENINYLRIGEYSATFRFPLQVNFINNIIEVRCDKKLLSVVQNENLMKEIKSIELKTINKLTEINESLTMKIVELENKCSVLETNTEKTLVELINLKEELKQNFNSNNNSLDLTISFDDEPISLNDNITSLNLTMECIDYNQEINLPQNLLIFKMVHYNIHNTRILESPVIIHFPNTLVKLSLYGLFNFRQFIDFKSMSNIKEIYLENLRSFAHPIDLPDKVEKVKIIDISYSYISKPSITIPSSVKFTLIGSNSFDRSRGVDFIINCFPIKCYSQNENVIQQLYTRNKFDINTSSKYGSVSFLKSKENWIRTTLCKGNKLSENITFF